MGCCSWDNRKEKLLMQRSDRHSAFCLILAQYLGHQSGILPQHIPAQCIPSIPTNTFPHSRQVGNQSPDESYAAVRWQSPVWHTSSLLGNTPTNQIKNGTQQVPAAPLFWIRPYFSPARSAAGSSPAGQPQQQTPRGSDHLYQGQQPQQPVKEAGGSTAQMPVDQ